MWPFWRKGPSGFGWGSTAEDVTHGIDGTGLTAIVTGASSGIGAETARVLALRGVAVVMGVRNMSAGRDVKDAILKKNPRAKLDVMDLDLSSMASVRNFAADFNSSYHSLNIIINNAGALFKDFTFSKDKTELTFATNYLGHFLMTNLLLDKMKKTAQASKIEGRIVNVSSSSHGYGGGIRFNHINDPSRYHVYTAYGQSKLANVLHANELARRLKEEEELDITANSLHPGGVATNAGRFHNKFIKGLINIIKPLFKNVQQGAATTCYVALHPGVKGVTGQYFVDSNVAKACPQARDVELAKKLWDFSLSLQTKSAEVGGDSVQIGKVVFSIANR